jgi:hypothetical protein
VNAVIEINEIGQTVHLHPFDGLIVTVAVAHWVQVPGVIKEHGLAVHARVGRRDSRNSGSFHARVAIAAINAVVADMMFMAELYGLLTREVLARHVRGTGNGKHGNQRQPDQKERREHTKTGDEVRASMKNLGHVSVAL